MAGPIRISVLANASQAKRERGGLGSSFKRTLGAGAALVGFAGITAGVQSVVKAASDAQQSLGGVESVFGRYADTVVKKSNRAAKSVGLSANQYRELSTVTGALLKNSGVPMDKLAGKTDKLVGRAADLAATFGKTTPEAMEALNSALKGEFDPLDSVGIKMSATKIQAELAARGQDKLKGAALDQAKAQATLDLIFKQSAGSAGQFAKESDTLAGQQQRLSAQLDNVKAKIGTALLPMLTKLAQWAGKEVVPALEDFGDWLDRNQGQITTTASKVSGTLLPPLKNLAGLAKTLIGFFADLPAPVRQFSLEAGVAALVLPKLNAAMSVSGAGLLNLGNRAKGARASVAGLGRGLGLVAGVGGMVALQEGATRSNKALTALGGGLTGAAAGAALGSAVFPGVGTAIGGIVGAAGGAGLALWQMEKAQKAAKDSAGGAKGVYQSWRDTLDQTTGAITANTRALALNRLQRNGMISQAQTLGISTRDLIGAMLGERDAMKRVNEATKGHTDLLKALTGTKLVDFLDSNRAALERARAKTREVSAATANYSGKLKGLPRAVRTEIQSHGIEPTTRGIAELAKRYRLTPKQIRTLIVASGTETTVKRVQNVTDHLKGVNKTRADLRLWKNGLDGFINRANADARAGAGRISGNLKDGTSRARPNLNPFISYLQGAISRARGTAHTGGLGIGDNLAAGAAEGVRRHAGAVAFEAGQMVYNAVSRARAAADARSPSRKMILLGQQMGEGLRIGLDDMQRDVARAGAQLSDSVTAAAAFAGTSGPGATAAYQGSRGADVRALGEALGQLRVPAPSVRVFIDGREVRAIARVEAAEVLADQQASEDRAYRAGVA